ncbi:unnamed protein product [Penicillium camemberti]|uniref:Str. FM013 n=1 Tax=Penicillium camemberti (strain FM 013) TaxID=1429867 RepID=A0A0G4NUH5_PENC3|nr:unnamed protein product [Penicillium camemberti]
MALGAQSSPGGLITLSESHARLYRGVELVPVGHLAALRITIEGRMAVQDTQNST